MTSASLLRATARRAIRLTTIAGASLALLAASAGAAAAAPMAVGGGTTAVTLDADTAGALGSLGVAVHRVGTARAITGGFTFPATGGRIDFNTAAGNVDHSGGLRFSSHGARIALTNFKIITIGDKPRIVARVNGSRSYRTVFWLSLSDVSLKRVGLGSRVGNVGVSLAPVGAAALRATFGSPAFTEGLAIGTATVAINPRYAVFTGGATELEVDSGTLGALTTLGIAPGAAANATLTGATYSFPITGGAAQVKTLAGRINHSGGITLTKGATVVALTNFRIDTVNKQLTGQVNGGERTALLDLDLSAPQLTVATQQLWIGNVPARFTAGAAAALNAAFTTTGFTKGLLLGTATIKGATA